MRKFTKFPSSSIQAATGAAPSSSNKASELRNLIREFSDWDSAYSIFQSIVDENFQAGPDQIGKISDEFYSDFQRFVSAVEEAWNRWNETDTVEESAQIQSASGLFSSGYSGLLERFCAEVAVAIEDEYGGILRYNIPSDLKGDITFSWYDPMLGNKSDGSNLIATLNIPLSDLTEEDLSDRDFFDNSVYATVNDLANDFSGDVIKGPAWSH